MKNLAVALIEPEIPQNTGNIFRTCACTGVQLHLVKPLGFSIDDAHLRRAGLDYWNELDLHIHENLESFLEWAGKEERPLLFASTKSARTYSDVEYPDGCIILFGKETKGLPEELLRDNYDKCIRIPMKESVRSLNLSNSVAIIVYEALRQSGFRSLSRQGHLKGVSGNE